MDASASPKSTANLNELYGFFLIENSPFPSSVRQKNTVIKYTKLPDFEFDSKVSWPLQNYTLQPRLRRIITVDDAEAKSNRSLKPELMPTSRYMTTKLIKRKIVTIAEDDKADLHSNFSFIDSEIKTNLSKKSQFMSPSKFTTSNLIKRKTVTIPEEEESEIHPKFLKNSRRSSPIKSSNRSVGTHFKEEKENSCKTSSRVNSLPKYSKEINSNAKTNYTYLKKEVSIAKQNHKGKTSNVRNIPTEYAAKIRNVKEKEPNRNFKSAYVSTKVSISKNIVTPSESENELSIIKNKLLENMKTHSPLKKSLDKSRSSKSPPPSNRNNIPFMKEIKTKNKPISVIHVPLDEKYQKRYPKQETDIFQRGQNIIEKRILKSDCSVMTDGINNKKHVNISTDPLPKTVNQTTEIDDEEIGKRCKSVESIDTQTEIFKETFDSLDIPNVTLMKVKNELTESDTFSKSLPNILVSTLNKTAYRKENEIDKHNDNEFCKSASYVLSRAILTCTTRQKIDFQLLGSKDDTNSNQMSSPLSYPMNVVSVFKADINHNESKDVSQKKDKFNVEYTNCINEQNSLNCSYIFNSNKLMKPSDMIGTITGNSSLLQNEYVCEQFQKELNFIDSFFESLQYLESCSLSDKCFKHNNVENFISNSGFEVKNPDYTTFLSKFRIGTNVDDSETMASKSLCLLNLLIRDEQRRAKNLLFVLKMREDALKDFTKSQILWLENKKRQENTDISTLKKKQRGALLKLQHECGEMQRMRKALLTLTEKRKLALMKTKKNLELKLQNNVGVEQIVFGKKKLKRSAIGDRSVAPIKCFDLSSSGCEESATSRSITDTVLITPHPPSIFTCVETTVTSAEKCIQTGDSITATILEDHSTDTAAENFVVVDGGYLNILFHNLSLPQIFSSRKQYEVNEEALRNIVNTSNSHHSNLNQSNAVQKLMDQIKTCDLERSRSPSTARSLVEEYNQYYKGLAEEERSQVDLPDLDYDNSGQIYDIKDTIVLAADRDMLEKSNIDSYQSSSTITSDSTDSVLSNVNAGIFDQPCESDPSDTVKLTFEEERNVETTICEVGPLPVPAGATATIESKVAPVSVWPLPKSSTASTVSEGLSVSSQPQGLSVSSISSLTSPVHCEAEELRRQQLAIEREIKVLEQQQCQLLVVREIPDKPPPPYTPPTDTRSSKLPQMFLADENIEDKIDKYVTDPTSATFDPTDPFDIFVKDYCQETLERQMLEQSDKPWDACNLLPQKQIVDSDKLKRKTSLHLKEILTGVQPTVVSGVGARRSDHIDDILFAEWRRCEPEWTALHTDEAIVKNQIFESIFQKILTETIDEYKKTVLCKSVTK